MDFNLKSKILNPKSAPGFTLIEVVVYLALFAILFGGAVLAAYNIVESSGRNQSKADIQQEGEFIIGKINWALSGAASVSSPGAGLSSTILSVVKFDTTTVTINNLDNCTGSATTNIFIQTTAGCYQLNDSASRITNLSFSQTASPGDGIDPVSILAGFTLTEKTPNGFDYSQDFSTNAYLRK